MTVRIAQKIGIKNLAKFSKNLGIYDEPDELLSISLGSAETTLLKLTSAYSAFVNGGKLVTPILIDRIQDSEGNTILNNEKRTCSNCDMISFTGGAYPEIKDTYKQIFSPQTAYQVTSLLEGVVKRGTGKKLRDLNLTSTRTFKYSANPEVLTGEIENLTNYSQRKKNLELRKKMFEDKEDAQSIKQLEKLEQLYTLGGVNFDSLIIIDFGTATTFDVIDSNGNYAGGVISPGINLSLETLHRAAAKLPRVAIKRPEQVIGKGTVEAMQSGIYWGYLSMLEGMVKRIKKEFGMSMKVVATGGLAPLFSETCELIDCADSNLTLQGLFKIYQLNTVS